MKRTNYRYFLDSSDTKILVFTININKNLVKNRGVFFLSKFLTPKRNCKKSLICDFLFNKHTKTVKIITCN